MVCHETYKDINGNWLYPEEIEKNSEKKAIKKIDRSQVIIGASESMSKSKKNTIDPETMINQYGADAVRWFILSDSPPEKDVQWSDAGVVSSNKFLQKIWNLNQSIINKPETKNSESDEEKFEEKIDLHIYKIDNSVNNFQFNVAIAQFYEIYKYFNDSIKLAISKKILISNITKVMKLMIPFTPHLAHECLLNLNCTEIDTWPKINEKVLANVKINMVIQINGKTRDILKIEKNLTERDINKLINDQSKAKKYIADKNIIKTIFVKNRILNYIVRN